MEVGHEIIQLGRHRLLCGDATNKEDVNKLLQGEVVDLLLTDAPYGISIVQPSSDGGGQSRSSVQDALSSIQGRVGHKGGPGITPFKTKKERERESKWGTIGGGKPATFKKTGKVRISAKPSKTFTTHTHLMITRSFLQEHINPLSMMTNPSTHNTFLTSMFPQFYSEETTSPTNSLLLTSGLYGTRNHHLMVTGIISAIVN